MRHPEAPPAAHPASPTPGRAEDGPTVWVTRSAPANVGSARALSRLGFQPVVAPLLSIREIPGPVDLTAVGALAFTSVHGVAAFAGRCERRGLPVFTVGDVTALAAQEAGFACVRSAGGDLQALVRLIARSRGGFSGAVLRPGARQPAGDFAGRLAAHGIEARTVAVYEASPVAPPADLVSRPAGAPPMAAVLIYSPRAGAQLAAHTSRGAPAASLAVCISESAARPLADRGYEVVVSDAPTEPAMFARLLARAARRR